MGLNVHGSEFASLEYSKDGGATWRRVPGISGYSETGGEAPERDAVAFEGVAKQSGLPRVPSIEMSAVYSPAHDSWRDLRKAALASTALLFRLNTKGRLIQSVVAAANQAKITDGILTKISFRNAADDAEAPSKLSRNLLSPGMVILIGVPIPSTGAKDLTKADVDGKYYVIDKIEGEGEVVTGNIEISPAADAVVAASPNYSTWLPSLRRGPFSATVRIGGNASLESENDMTTSLTLAPRDQLPEWDFTSLIDFDA